MSQEINLYEARLRPQRCVLNGRALAWVLLVLLLVLFACAVQAHLAAQGAEKALAAMKTRVSAEQEKLAALGKQRAERPLPPALQAELEATRALLATRQEVMTLLDSGALGNSSGFSALLYGFARQSSNDVWLTGFTFSQGGQEIEIRGRLFDSARLPAYVQRLRREPAFQGRRFAALNMQSVDPAEAMEADKAAASAAGALAAANLPRYVAFVLRSEKGGEADKESRK